MEQPEPRPYEVEFEKMMHDLKSPDDSYYLVQTGLRPILKELVGIRMALEAIAERTRPSKI